MLTPEVCENPDPGEAAISWKSMSLRWMDGLTMDVKYSIQAKIVITSYLLRIRLWKLKDLESNW